MSNVTDDLSQTSSQSATAEQDLVYDTPEGITEPPIDELLTKVSSKYAPVSYTHLTLPTNREV